MLCSLLLLPLLGACSKEELVFDVEYPQFPTRDGYQLLEVIVPPGTLPDDRIYLVGDFNGGEEEAIGNPKWELEKAAKTDAKWGIYVNPADLGGASLADGYYFVSTQQGRECSAAKEEVTHHDSPALGKRVNVSVAKWINGFGSGEEETIDHDGYTIYVVDNSGYADLALYAWGDAEAFGGWPGMTVTGTTMKDGVVFKYFDTGEANRGLNLNLIFNNNGGGEQLGDYNVTLDKDYYLELTPDGVKEYEPSANVTHDGYAIFVADANSGWDALYLYMWGDVNDLNGAWPGMEPTGSVTIKGVGYKYFDLGEANIGLNEHVILNDGNGTQIDDVVVFPCDRDVYIALENGKATEIDPDTYVPGEAPSTPPSEDEPTVDPDATYYYLYVEDNTGWENLYIYAWGDKEIFGGWPGKPCDRITTIAGVTYKVWSVAADGETENLIFNDNAGTQYDAATVVLDKDYTFKAEPGSAIAKAKARIIKRKTPKQ